MFRSASKMAATRSVSRFVNSTFSTSFSGVKIAFIGSKSKIRKLTTSSLISALKYETFHYILDFQSCSRISFQLTRPARQLSTQNRQRLTNRYHLSCDQTLAKTMCQKLAPTSRARTLSTIVSKPLLCLPLANLVSQRGITMVSKKGKRKTCKAVAKRFIRTGKGKLKRWRCGKHHNQTKKSGRRKRFLRKPTYASKTQLKTLNKMLNGW